MIKVGDIITAYRAGIHVVVNVERRYYLKNMPPSYTVLESDTNFDIDLCDEEASPLVYYKTLYNSKGKKQNSNKIYICDKFFCKPYEEFLENKLVELKKEILLFEQIKQEVNDQNRTHS